MVLSQIVGIIEEALQPPKLYLSYLLVVARIKGLRHRVGKSQMSCIRTRPLGEERLGRRPEASYPGISSPVFKTALPGGKEVELCRQGQKRQ